MREFVKELRSSDFCGGAVLIPVGEGPELVRSEPATALKELMYYKETRKEGV